MLRKALLPVMFALAAVVLLAGPARATLYNGSYTVSANGDSGAGLAVMTLNNFGSPVNASTNSFIGLNVPDATPHFTDLFELFALESPPYSGNDLVPQLITVTFNFTSPFGVGGMLSGTTTGMLNDEGLLHWNGPLNLIFPSVNGLRITLSDAQFGDSFNGIVSAQFVQFIPEPGTVALLCLGLIGVLVRRNRMAA